MQTIQNLSEPRKATGPLEIDGQNIVELSQKDPKAAYDLVFREVDRRGGHKALISFRARQSCVKEAMAKPLPGASVNILKGAIKVGERFINPVVPIHFAVLQELNSPLLELISKATSEKKAELKNPTQEQKWEMCFVFSTDAKQLFRNLKSKGVDWVKSQAFEEIGCEWNPGEIELAMPAIMEQLRRHIECTVKFASDMEAKGDVRFFRETPESQ